MSIIAERCIPERSRTLELQQAALKRGTRDVQMFPLGTSELPVPDGFARHSTPRGVFHFRKERISPQQIDALSSQGRENEFLNLGPYSKADIAARLCAGERALCITEYTPEGIELRSAAGSDSTVEQQRDYFERTKEPGSMIVVGDLAIVLLGRMI